MEHQTLVDYFMKRMVDPVVATLRDKNVCSEEIAHPLKMKIDQVGEDLINEINRSCDTIEIKETIAYLLDKVDEKNEEVISSPLSVEEDSPSRPTTIEPVSSCSLENCSVDLPLSADDSFSNKSSPVANDMPSQKRAKRSLEDTVQMLSKESAVPTPLLTPRILYHPSLSLMFPHVAASFPDASVMEKYLSTPFPNQAYLNTMNIFKPQKPSGEQIEDLMKMSMHAASLMKNIIGTPFQTNNSESDVEDVKIGVECDDGEMGTSPSSSSGDITENDYSSTSTGPMTSPASGDGECAAEKPFICMHNHCGKRFANKFLLKKHMFIHTGLRPHTCPHCHKKFNRKDNLLRHKKTHLAINAGIGQKLTNNIFQSLPSIPVFHNIALAQGFAHHHSLNLNLGNGASAVRGLS
ncbi:unnamed protein product [Caenorhabditis brenneri]